MIRKFTKSSHPKGERIEWFTSETRRTIRRKNLEKEKRGQIKWLDVTGKTVMGMVKTSISLIRKEIFKLIIATNRLTLKLEKITAATDSVKGTTLVTSAMIRSAVVENGLDHRSVARKVIVLDMIIETTLMTEEMTEPTAT